MVVRKVTLRDLSPPVRSFFDRIKNGHRVVVEDENGRAKYGIVVYREATPKQQAAAWQRLQRLQKKVGKMMERTGKTEAELDKLLQDEDRG